MRRYRRSLQVGLLLVIAAFIASLFVFGQRGFGDGSGRDSVATVNGEAIPLARYERAYQAYVNMYSQTSRQPMTAEFAERLGLDRQVMDALVQEALVVQRARTEGLEAYDDDVRRELTSRRMRGLVTSGVKVTPAEVEHALVLRREEVRAAWALVELGPLFAAATASDDELGKYLSAHPDEFRQPERRKVLSVTLAWKDFLKPVADDAVERYYREHATEFEEPRRARVSHVLVRVPEAGGSEGEDKARAKVADVIRRATAGGDFAKLAKDNSEDPGSAP